MRKARHSGIPHLGNWPVAKRGGAFSRHPDSFVA
jgi:hypothetical protein